MLLGETATFVGNDSFVCSMFCVFVFTRLHGFDRVASSYIGLTEFPGEAFGTQLLERATLPDQRATVHDQTATFHWSTTSISHPT